MSQEPFREEYVPEDDAVIGRAFRWSLLVIAFIGVAVVALLYFRGGEVSGEVTREIDAQAPRPLERSGDGLPAVPFVDITRVAGIDFVHQNGAEGDKFLPETMGAGAAFFDFDGDQDQDLLLVDSAPWPWSKSKAAVGGPRLYANDGRGHFRDVSAEVGFGDVFYGTGVAVGDYDGDGDIDVFFSAVGPDRLYRNDGGRFVEVTAQAGVAGGDKDWSSSAAFFDSDNDGDLDLFVCNYVRWTREIDLELGFTLNGSDRAYGPPNNFAGTHPHLYRNEGGGRFKDVSEQAGVQVDNPSTGEPMAKGLALVPVDLDGDSFIDLIVANDTVQNLLFHNRGDGSFEEIGAEAGLAFDFNGQATGAMGIDAAHYGNDDRLAIGVANFANEMSSLYVTQDEPLWFADEAIGQGIGSPSRLFLSFGLFFFDYDLDGRLDLLQANGHLEEEITQVQSSQKYEQSAQLFWNSGQGFQEVAPQATGDLARPIVGRGSSYADIDGDGDLDVILTQAGRAPLLLRNDQKLGHHWLRVSLRDSGANRFAVGAWIEVTAGGQTQRRQVMPTRSYLSQVELPVTFGLGEASSIESMRVRWPGRQLQEVAPPAVDQLLIVQRR